MKCFLLLLVVARLHAATIESKDLTLTDVKRKRDVPVRVYFPSGRATLPVLVFSHGLGGSREGYRYLSDSWANAGYVVIVPTHLGSDADVFKKHHPFENLRTLKKALQDPENLKNRPADVSFVLDSLDEIERGIPALKGRLDRVAFGLAGHSFGAMTTVAVAGGPAKDPRFKAFIAMSPQGEGEWKDIHAPFMAMTGMKDRGLAGQLPKWRLTLFDRLPPGDKYSAYIEGAGHFSFAGSPAEAQKFQSYVVRVSTAFWDAYLKKDGAAKALLTQDLLGKESQGEVRVESR